MTRHRLDDTPLITQAALSERVCELGAQISRDYEGRDLHFVAVLKGAVFFVADLMRAVAIPCSVDFMAVSSYGSGSERSGIVRILKDLDASIAGRDVVLVEDIVDSGLTLSYLLRNLRARDPRTLEVCALLSKPDRHEVPVESRYLGFEIPNRFVVGYGLDVAEQYRSLPYIGTVNTGGP